METCDFRTLWLKLAELREGSEDILVFSCHLDLLCYVAHLHASFIELIPVSDTIFVFFTVRLESLSTVLKA